MATLARWEHDAVDDAGNILTDVSVEVRRESDNVLASVYSDRAGASSLGNPFTVADGKIAFHVAGGAYKIVLTSGSYTRTLRHVAIGRASETDLQVATPAGGWSSGTTYAAGDLVSYSGKVFISLQDSNTNHTPDASTPGDTAWWMYVAVLQGDKAGIRYAFSTTTIDSDPGAGTFRANNSTIASVTSLFFDNADALGVTQTAWLDGFDDVGGSVSGSIVIKSNDNADTTVAIFNVNGAVVDGTGYRKVPVAYVSGTLPSNGEACVVEFIRAGVPGASGEPLLVNLMASAGVGVGQYVMARWMHDAATFVRFKGSVETGTGEMQVSVLVNGITELGPFTFDETAELDETVSLSVAQDDTVELAVLAAEATITWAMVQLDAGA